MKFLIIGTGHISERFADALKRLGHTPHSVYSRSMTRAEQFRAEFGARYAYSDLRTALSDTECDGVYVASPNICHCEHAVAALSASKHVLCEKALATNYSEYRDMKDTAQACGRLLIEAMRPAYDPVTEVIEDAVSKIGRVRRVSLSFCQYSSRYDAFKSGTVLNAFNPELKNSALFDLGVYPLYMALRLFGEPTSTARRSVYLENGFEGGGTLTLGYPDMLCDISYSKIHDSHGGNFIEGESGSVWFDRLNSPKRVRIFDRSDSVSEIAVPECENNMVYEIDAFIKMTRGEFSAAEHCERSRLLMKILDSVKPY